MWHQLHPAASVSFEWEAILYRVKLTTSNQRVGLDDSDANRHASTHQSLFNARDSGVDGIKLTAFRLDLQLQQLPALPPAVARVTDGSRCIYEEESMRLMQRQMLITPSKRESSALVLFKLVCQCSHEAIRLAIFSPGARVPSKNEKNICFLTGRVLKHDTKYVTACISTLEPTRFKNTMLGWYLMRGILKQDSLIFRKSSFQRTWPALIIVSIFSGLFAIRIDHIY